MNLRRHAGAGELGDGTSAKAIVRRLRFSHPSRFTAAYREFHGENPTVMSDGART